MFRNLRTIEIAEGALLADIAVIAQLAVMYLPFVGDVFRSLIFLAFSILVLRRGLYAALFGLGVALFLIIVLMGPTALPLTFLECVGGLFLGVTMRLRFPPFLLLLIGVLCGAIGLYGLLLLVPLLAGRSLDTVARTIDQFNAVLGQVTVVVVARFGIIGWWHSNVEASALALGVWFRTYWWFALYLIICLILTPFVTIIYAFTNIVVRQLGYDVLPFPGRRLERVVRKIVRSVIGILLGVVKRWRVWRRHRGMRNLERNA
ncbi:DUF2232 domain-containing protein [Ktedonospora formicarum]|uniref:DUF2232 domain-containing protein n=1 Tax=Ktedonospora formicarum TaxID=2778364 RepID=A0A8J3MQM9_9CHLR|nr:DUF2232 domain-containing protein [Ktedonospora formicarum]GHO42941.1 hypothetical protein KSX_11040 [Ktedonospora formicarum]